MKDLAQRFIINWRIHYLLTLENVFATYFSTDLLVNIFYFPEITILAFQINIKIEINLNLSNTYKYLREILCA